MIYFIFLLFIYFVPTLWVKYTLGKHNGDLPNMPYTALEFGNELLKEKDLNDVKLKIQILEIITIQIQKK